MQLVITGRHTQISQSDKALIEEKLEKYKKKISGLTKAEVIVNLEAERHNLEIILHVSHQNPLIVKTSAGNNATALDLAIQKLDNLVSKMTGKRHDFQRSTKQ